MTTQLSTRLIARRRPINRRWPVSAVVPALLAVLLWTGPVAAASGPASVADAGAAVAEAISMLEGQVEQLPRQAQLEIGSEVQFLAQSGRDLLHRLQRQPVVAAVAGVEEELLFVHDLMRAIGAELDRIRSGVGRGAEDGVRNLAAAAEARIDAAGRALERHASALEGTVVKIERTPDGMMLRLIDRTLHDGIRLGAVALLLIGLLVIGLRLLALSETELSVGDLVRQTPALAIIGMAAVGAFMAASAALATNPQLLAGLAERTEVRSLPAPCARLAVQREQLLEARAIDHDPLSDAVKTRMRPVAQDCLGLDSQVAAVEAIEWLSARLGPLDPRPETRSGRAAPGRAMAAEIERLISSAQALNAAVGDEAPTGSDGGAGVAAGGPALELEEEAAAPVPATRRVVTTTRVNYRSGPSTNARRLGTLPQGAEATLLGETGSWSNIQLADGRSVYVASAYVRSPR